MQLDQHEPIDGQWYAQSCFHRNHNDTTIETKTTLARAGIPPHQDVHQNTPTHWVMMDHNPPWYLEHHLGVTTFQQKSFYKHTKHEAV